MRWFPRLYTGPMAASSRYSIIQGLRAGKSMPSLYVITRAVDSDGILDIYRSAEFQKRKVREADPMILGLALTRDEAFEVARNIIDDLYRKNGDFDIDAFCNSSHT
ncbi:MAG: hypothetical protein IJT43_11045 [Stomatobaculum sp.]|nr:hypothetical protein [Stomatobaculum sp.]